MHGWTQGPSEPGPSASATICLARKACLLPVSLDVTAPGTWGRARLPEDGPVASASRWTVRPIGPSDRDDWERLYAG